jgi:endonuclease YncB( thermonuclease family)
MGIWGWVVVGVVAVGAIGVAFDGDEDPSTNSDSAVSTSEDVADSADSGTGAQAVAPAVPAAAAPSRPKTYKVVSVTDGDTLRLANGEAVRLVGIDSPEEGECGSLRAADLLTRLVEGRRVTLVAPVDDRDRYDRLLRYVNLGTMDAGLRMIKNGLAIARYDSRDGYGAHPREACTTARTTRSPT